MTEKIYISWSDFHQHVKLLAEQIKSSTKDFKQIVAVSRGGLLPAGILSYELNIRNCELINVSSYDDSKQRSDKDVEIISKSINYGAETLIVDDLADSGRTVKMLKNLYPSASFACVYAKPQGREIADFQTISLPDKWVVFPWD